jgi:type III polyketide synthase
MIIRQHRLEKTLLINRHTKILQRPMIQTTSSPLINARTPPTIKAVNKLFMEQGVEMAVRAAKDAIEDWGGRLQDITHLSELKAIVGSEHRRSLSLMVMVITVCNTCTASSYP